MEEAAESVSHPATQIINLSRYRTLKPAAIRRALLAKLSSYARYRALPLLENTTFILLFVFFFLAN